MHLLREAGFTRYDYFHQEQMPRRGRSLCADLECPRSLSACTKCHPGYWRCSMKQRQKCQSRPLVAVHIDQPYSSTFYCQNLTHQILDIRACDTCSIGDILLIASYLDNDAFGSNVMDVHHASS